MFKNLAERKKRSQEDIVRLEAEITELHATHEVGFLYMFWTVFAFSVLRFLAGCRTRQLNQALPFYVLV